MQNAKFRMMGLALGLVACGVIGSAAFGDEHEKVEFTGPHAEVLKKRHELMEGMATEAKNINDAVNEGPEMAVIQRSSAVIVESAAKIPELFPKGSTSPESRAKPDIWKDWDKFKAHAKKLQESAQAVNMAADSDDNGMIFDLVKTMGGACKSCHDDFRKPEEK